MFTCIQRLLLQEHPPSHVVPPVVPPVFRQSFRYKDFFSDTGPVLDAASSRKATTTYPTRMRLAAAMAEMAAHVVEPT